MNADPVIARLRRHLASIGLLRSSRQWPSVAALIKANPRIVLRRILRSFGYDFHSLPVKRVGLRDLRFDLPELVRSPSPVIFDVGANNGQTIELMKECFPTGQIVAFEPNPDLYSKLRTNFAAMSVLLEGVAVGNSTGEIDFIVLENDELSSVLEIDRHPDNPFSSTSIRRIVKVPITTLDAYCSANKIDKIDLLKIDSQGFDLRVLQGAEGLLSDQKIEVLLVEVNFVSLYRGQCNFGEIEQFLARNGYGLLGLYEVVRKHGCIQWATSCFLKMGQLPA